MDRARVGVLISGRGSNLQALIAACEAPDYPADIALVIANVADAKGLEHAKRAGIPCCVISHKDFPDRARFDTALDSALRQADIKIVCLAGFMRLLGETFTAAWRDRVLNIHPSLLPAFPGLNTHRKVIEAGVKISGCTVHLVRPELDAGPILIQAAVPVTQDDTPETLAARVLEMEHRCYPLALRLLATNGIRVEENRTRLAATPVTPAGGFLNPETQS